MQTERRQHYQFGQSLTDDTSYQIVMQGSKAAAPTLPATESVALLLYLERQYQALPGVEVVGLGKIAVKRLQLTLLLWSLRVYYHDQTIDVLCASIQSIIGLLYVRPKAGLLPCRRDCLLLLNMCCVAGKTQLQRVHTHNTCGPPPLLPWPALPNRTGTEGCQSSPKTEL